MRTALLSSLESDAFDAISRDCAREVGSKITLLPLVVGPIRRNEVFDIYSRRAVHCEKRKVGIDGFPRLVESLRDESVEEVKLYDFTVIHHWCVFVDAATDGVLGVLRFPLKKEPNQSLQPTAPSRRG